MLDSFLSLLPSTLIIAAPLALAAIGGLSTALSGSLSIALEGCMSIGAFAAAMVGRSFGLYAGLAAGAGSGAMLSLIVGGISLGLKADVFVAGLAANLLAPGLVSMLSQAAFGTKGVVSAEAMRSGPWPILLVTVLIILVEALLLNGTVFGLRLKASGSASGDDASRAAGISPSRYRLSAHLLAGASAGIAGAALTAGVGAFVPGMVTGKGWLALVAVFLGTRTVLGTLAACLLFGFLLALANAGQALWTNTFAINAVELLEAIPYLAAAAALVIWRSLEKRKKARS